MSSSLESYDKNYIRFIIDEIEHNVPSCHSDYGWDYDDLEEVIEDGLKINISLPSYKEWIKQRDREQKINDILK